MKKIIYINLVLILIISSCNTSRENLEEDIKGYWIPDFSSIEYDLGDVPDSVEFYNGEYGVYEFIDGDEYKIKMGKFLNNVINELPSELKKPLIYISKDVVAYIHNSNYLSDELSLYKIEGDIVKLYDFGKGIRNENLTEAFTDEVSVTIIKGNEMNIEMSNSKGNSMNEGKRSELTNGFHGLFIEYPNSYFRMKLNKTSKPPIDELLKNDNRKVKDFTFKGFINSK